VERLTDRTLGSGESARFTGPGAIVVLEVLTMDLPAEFRSAVSLRPCFSRQRNRADSDFNAGVRIL
jgi:hypothetical protein